MLPSSALLALVLGLRLVAADATLDQGQACLSLRPDGVDVQLTLAPSADVTLRWSRALEARLTGFARREDDGWHAIRPAIDSDGSRLVLRFPGGESTRLRWSVRPPKRWESPISGAAHAELLAIPATTLLPTPDRPVGRVPLRVVSNRDEQERVILPTGPMEGGATTLWAPNDPRWSAGLLVSGRLSRRALITENRRTLRVWSSNAAGSDWDPATLTSEVAQALELLGPSPTPLASDLVIVGAEDGPFADGRMAWAGTHLLREDGLIEREALRLVTTQLLFEVKDRSALWLVHGLRSVLPAVIQGTRDSLRLELWDRYSSLRAWKEPIATEPIDALPVVRSAWAEVGTALATEHLLDRTPLEPRRALRALSRLAVLDSETRGPELARVLGAQAAEFHAQSIDSFQIMPPPADVRARTSTTLPATGSRRDGEHFVFLASANQHGYLETCGCVLNQNGGAARRNTVLQSLRAQHPRALVLDAGNFLAPPTDHVTGVSSADVGTFIDTMEIASYDAIGASPTDLGLLLGAYPDGTHPRIPLLAGNAGSRSGVSAWAPSIALERDGRRIEVLGWCGPSPEQIDTSNWLARGLLERVSLSDPFVAVGRWLEQVPSDSLRVVLGQLSPALVEELVRRYPQIDVVLTARYHAMTPSHGDPDQVHLYGQSGRLGNTLVLYATMGYYGLTMFQAERTSLGEWVALDEKPIELGPEVSEHTKTRGIIEEHYARVHPPEAWDVAPLFPAHDSGTSFAGSASCASCHPDIYRHWQGTEHGTAYETLLAVRRQFVPECVRCHVVGLGTETGFQPDMGLESALKGVGCEQCHGPGEEHVKRPTRDSIARSLPGPGCATCHDAEHSPAFAGQQERYLERIRHW